MKAIALLSGGQDSTTALAWAVKEFGQDEVLALSINYGQRHVAELEAASFIAGMLKVKHETMNIPAFGHASLSMLTKSDGSVSGDSEFNIALPASFVPARNALFLTLAAGVAARFHVRDIVMGVCQTDYSGYPDCRRDFIDSMEESLSLALGMGKSGGLSIHTPLMFKTKAETIHLIQRLQAEYLLGFTLTCYEGKTPPCQVCPACKLRAKGFQEAGVKDPLLNEVQF